MLMPNFFRDSRLFLHLGFGLIFLAAVSLPAKVRVIVQPEVMETELYRYGPIFAIMIGAWSLPALTLGIAESSASKKAVLLRFSSILLLANTVLALSIWDAMRFWRDMFVQWLLSYGALLIPCIVANLIVLLYFAKREKLTEALKNPRVRILSISILMGVPLLIATTLFYMWLATMLY
jgi:hypothetical protein